MHNGIRCGTIPPAPIGPCGTRRSPYAPAVDTDGQPDHARGTLPSGQAWQSWTPPQTTGVDGVVALVHGVHEHGGRYAHVARRLAADGWATFAVDHPGHGRSPGSRGTIGSMAATVEGVRQLVALAGAAHPDVPVFVYGHSLGGLVALQYLTGSPDPRVRGAVVSAAALDTSTATGLQRLVAPVLSRFLPDLPVLALDPTTISRDPAVVADYEADPLNHHGRMTARTGAETMATAAAMPARLRTLTLPLLVLHGGADALMPASVTELLRREVASPDLTVTVYEGLAHEPHNEPEKDRVLDDVAGWLAAHRG